MADLILFLSLVWLLAIGLGLLWYAAFGYKRDEGHCVESSKDREAAIASLDRSTRQAQESVQSNAEQMEALRKLYDKRPEYKFTRSDDGRLQFESDEWPEVIGD